MVFFKKLFGSNKPTGNNEKVYKSIDNLGTTYNDYKKVNAVWQAQGLMLDKGNKVTLLFNSGETKEIASKGHPYICYTYNSEEEAKRGLLSISFIKKASDTNEFISLEILEFGCYETETNGIWEVIIWGDNFTKEMFDEARLKLEKVNGKKKGERIPWKKSQNKTKPETKVHGTSKYVRTDKKGPNTYEIYKANSKSVALEFLKNKTVAKSLYYIIVETPEGNWGKDIDGIYQE